MNSTPTFGGLRLLPLFLALVMVADAFGASRPQVAPLKKGSNRHPAAQTEESAPAVEAEAPAVERTPARSPSGGDDDAARRAWKKLGGRVDVLEKQLEKIRKENADLKEQVKLLYSIVNKLAGLQQGN